MELFCHNDSISHRKISSLSMGKNKDCLEKSKGMRPFSPPSLTSLQSKRSKELPCQNESPNWNSHTDEGTSSYKMPDANIGVKAHLLKGNLKSAPSYSLFPNPGLCLVTYTINKAVVFMKINRDM